MRAALFALIAMTGFAAFSATPAEARDYPFCLRSASNGDECYYPTYEACREAASGRGVTCFANPALAYGAPYDDAPISPRRRSHRRNYY